MAPVEPDLRTSNTLPIALFSTQIALIASLTVVVLRTIRRAARTLPPPSSTRGQVTNRQREVAVFATLAGLSFATITYCTIAWRKASYLAWADEGKFEIPGSIWNGWYGTGEGDDAKRWWLGRWLNDVGYLKEAEDLGLKVPLGVFWLDQEFLGLAVGGLFMGVEGHRRNLPLTTTVAFVLLSQICGLSYALNLFFLAMIYTPIPLHRALPPRRDPLWTPRPMVYRIPLALSFVSLGFMYRNTNSDLAKTALRVGYFTLPIYLATAIEFIPANWGIQHHTTASAHRSLLSFFRFASFASPLFYVFDTVRSINAETPSKNYGYNYVWNMHQSGVRSPYDRATTAITGFVMSLSKHPALSATSSDVALAALSLLVWAFVRGLDVNEMLNSGVLAYFFGTSDKHEKHVAFEDELSSKAVKGPSPSETPGKRSRGRPKKNESVSKKTESVSKKNGSVSTPLRRSTRRKTISEQDSDSEDAFKPSTQTKDEIAATEHDAAEGDDLVADGEAVALGLGLYVVGGLGTLAAAVLGAEVGGS